MNRADRASRAHLIAVAALLGTIVCVGCSSPGDMHRNTAADAHRNAAPDVHRDTAEVAANGSATSIRKPPPTRAEADLQRGIRSYEDAEYGAATRSLRSALEHGLQAPEDKVTAHKYLAFVACTSGRTKSCHAEFRNALRVDPTFDLAPAEAGHPNWGPVFRKVKLEVNGKGKTRQPDTSSYASR